MSEQGIPSNPKVCIESASGNVYEVAVDSNETVDALKQRLREQDWNAWGVAYKYQNHNGCLNTKNSPDPIEEAPSTDILKCCINVFEDNSNDNTKQDTEFDALLSSDKKTVLAGSTLVCSLFPDNADLSECSTGVAAGKKLKLYYLLTGRYPTYSDLLYAGIRRRTGYSLLLMLALDIIVIVVGALFTAAMAQASFNLPKSWSTYVDQKSAVPVTFQTFSLLVVATLLGASRGFMSMALYVCMIAAGAPFAALHTGGTEVLTGASAGFIYGFMPSAALVGYLAERGWDRKWLWILLSMILGEIVLYVFGLIYLPFGIAKTYNISPHNAVCGFGRGCVGNTLWFGLVPFIPGDVIKIALACFVLPIGWKLLGVRASQALNLRNAAVRERQYAKGPAELREKLCTT